MVKMQIIRIWRNTWLGYIQMNDYIAIALMRYGAKLCIFYLYMRINYKS